MFRKDSLELTDDDRLKLKPDLSKRTMRIQYVISHGTDTMVETADILNDLPGKTIVLDKAH